MATATHYQSRTVARPSAGPPGQPMVVPQDTGSAHRVVNWRGIVAGGATAIGLLLVGATLWNALAYSSNYAWFAEHIEWLNAVTVIGSFLVGALIAGFLGRRGALPGFMNGLTMWGGLLAIYVVLGVGRSLPLLNVNAPDGATTAGQSGSFWPTFVAYSVGLAAAVIGGVIGAFIPRPSRYDDDEPVLDLRDEMPSRQREETEAYAHE